MFTEGYQLPTDWKSYLHMRSGRDAALSNVTINEATFYAPAPALSGRLRDVRATPGYLNSSQNHAENHPPLTRSHYNAWVAKQPTNLSQRYPHLRNHLSHSYSPIRSRLSTRYSNVRQHLDTRCESMAVSPHDKRYSAGQRQHGKDIRRAHSQTDLFSDDLALPSLGTGLTGGVDNVLTNTAGNNYSPGSDPRLSLSDQMSDAQILSSNQNRSSARYQPDRRHTYSLNDCFRWASPVWMTESGGATGRRTRFTPGGGDGGVRLGRPRPQAEEACGVGVKSGQWSKNLNSQQQHQQQQQQQHYQKIQMKHRGNQQQKQQHHKKQQQLYSDKHPYSGKSVTQAEFGDSRSSRVLAEVERQLKEARRRFENTGFNLLTPQLVKRPPGLVPSLQQQQQQQQQQYHPQSQFQHPRKKQMVPYRPKSQPAFESRANESVDLYTSPVQMKSVGGRIDTGSGEKVIYQAQVYLAKRREALREAGSPMLSTHHASGSGEVVTSSKLTGSESATRGGGEGAAVLCYTQSNVGVAQPRGKIDPVSPRPHHRRRGRKHRGGVSGTSVSTKEVLLSPWSPAVGAVGKASSRRGRFDSPLVKPSELRRGGSVITIHPGDPPHTNRTKGRGAKGGSSRKTSRSCGSRMTHSSRTGERILDVNASKSPTREKNPHRGQRVTFAGSNKTGDSGRGARQGETGLGGATHPTMMSGPLRKLEEARQKLRALLGADSPGPAVTSTSPITQVMLNDYYSDDYAPTISPAPFELRTEGEGGLFPPDSRYKRHNPPPPPPPAETLREGEEDEYSALFSRSHHTPDTDKADHDRSSHDPPELHKQQLDTKVKDSSTWSDTPQERDTSVNAAQSVFHTAKPMLPRKPRSGRGSDVMSILSRPMSAILLQAPSAVMFAARGASKKLSSATDVKQSSSSKEEGKSVSQSSRPANAPSATQANNSAQLKKTSSKSADPATPTNKNQASDAATSGTLQVKPTPAGLVPDKNPPTNVNQTKTLPNPKADVGQSNNAAKKKRRKGRRRKYIIPSEGAGGGGRAVGGALRGGQQPKTYHQLGLAPLVRSPSSENTFHFAIDMSSPRTEGKVQAKPRRGKGRGGGRKGKAVKVV